MEYVGGEVVCVLGGIVAFWLLIAASGAFPLVLLWFADFRYLGDSRETIIRASYVHGEEWLASVGFSAEGAIRPLGIPMALFRHQDNHTALAVYFAGGKVVTDIVTRLGGNVSLTTTSTVDGVTLPSAPGSVMQSLPSLDRDQRWQAHLDAVERLREQLSVTEPPILGPLAEDVEYSTRRQIRNVFSHPWLILTFPYRYFVSRIRYRNVTVATQLERGWINTHALFDLSRAGTG